MINKVDIATGEVMRIKPPEFNFQQRQNNSTRFIHFGGLSNGEFIVLFQTTDIQSNQSKASIWSYQYSKNSLEHQMDLEVGEEEIFHFSERIDGKLWLWGRKKNYYLVNLQQRSFNIFPMPSQYVDDESYHEFPIDENRNLWFPSINPEHSS